MPTTNAQISQLPEALQVLNADLLVTSQSNQAKKLQISTLIAKLREIFTDQGAGLSNSNLLDNGWFTINQRSVSTLPSNAYCVDRWVTYNASGTVSDAGINVTAGNIYQKLEPSLAATLVGKTVTASALWTDGTIETATAEFTGETVQFPGGAFELTVGTVTAFSYYGHHNIRALKLEIGGVSTLAYDALPDYTTELQKCQRYLWRLIMRPTSSALWTGYVATAGASPAVWLTVFPPVPMRTVPSVAASDWSKFYVASVAGARFNLSSAPTLNAFARETQNGQGSAIVWTLRISTSGGDGFNTRYSPACMLYVGGSDVTWLEFNAEL